MQNLQYLQHVYGLPQGLPQWDLAWILAQSAIQESSNNCCTWAGRYSTPNRNLQDIRGPHPLPKGEDLWHPKRETQLSCLCLLSVPTQNWWAQKRVWDTDHMAISPPILSLRYEIFPSCGNYYKEAIHDFQVSAMDLVLDMLSLTSTASHWAESLYRNEYLSASCFSAQCCRCINWQTVHYKVQQLESVFMSLIFTFHAHSTFVLSICLQLLSFVYFGLSFSRPYSFPTLFLFLPISLSLSFSLAVDYFWSAWLISVESQAQCQGKWSAY